MICTISDTYIRNETLCIRDRSLPRGNSKRL